MPPPAEDFSVKRDGTDDSSILPSFSCMSKDSVGQTYCYLNKLIKGKSVKDFDNARELVKPLETLSLFEDSLRLVLVDSLQLADNVVEILFSQNNYHINRILKCHWFFKNSLTPEQYFQDIFPHVSLSVRNKLFSILSKKLVNERDAEKFVTFIKDNYGKVRAEHFLPKCSSDFILKYIAEEYPSFQYNKGCTIVKFIAQRYPSVVLDLYTNWLEGKNKNISFVAKHATVLLYLASYHTDLFLPFFARNFPNLLFLNFGIKLSRKIGPKVKEALFNNRALMNSDVFKKEAVFEVLSFDDQVKFLAALVRLQRDNLTFSNWLNCAFDLSQLLRLVKPNCRLLMVESVFRQVYNLELKDHLRLFDPQIMEIIPLTDRAPCVEAYEQVIAVDSTNDKKNCRFYDGLAQWSPSQDPENYVYLHPFDVAFSKLKAALSKATTIHRRQDIVRSMIRNCSVNRDVVNLKDLVEFISVRFRNDTSQTYVQFLNELFASFPLESLDSSIITKVEEMLHLCFVKNERYNFGYLMEKCMTYRLCKNSDVDAQVRQVVDFAITDKKMGSPFIDDFKGKKARELFFQFYKEALKRIESDRGLSETIPTWFLATMAMYNRINKKQPICFTHVPDLVPHFKTLTSKRSGELFSDVEITSGLELSFYRFLNCQLKVSLLRQILKRDPYIVTKKLQQFIDYMVASFHASQVKGLFLFLVKILSFMGLVQELKQIILNKFKHGKTVPERKTALIMFAHICRPEEFELAIEDYMPKGDTIDSQASTDMTQVQLVLPGYIRFVQPSWKNMDLILKFFVGDFFRYVLVSFYTCCYWTRVDELIPRLLAHLKSLSRHSRLAVKKEIIRVLLQVSNFREAVEACSTCWDAIDHHSVRGLLFQKTSAAFLERPTTELFQLIEKFIRNSDEVVIDFRPEVRRIPPKFFYDYVRLLWEFSESQSPKLKKNIRNSVIWNLTMGNIGLLPTEFTESLIKNYLFKGELDVTKFAIFYLIMDESSSSKKLKFIIQVHKESNSGPSGFSNFLKTLREVVRNTGQGLKIFDKILSDWPFEDKSILYDIRLVIHFYSLYYKIFCSGGTIEDCSMQFGRELKAFLLSQQGLDYLISAIIESIRTFYREIVVLPRVLNLLIYIKGLLEGEKNTAIAILAIMALPQVSINLYQARGDNFNPKEVVERERMSEIVKLLNGHEDPAVQIYYRQRFPH
ncbi:hypothetical protein RUM44_005909 [Polyplax serrata]|uniref:Uncharacterized protein n=1 Tax=Polyplax serrata TaxID=468196 RepID=A0ABR1AZY6_POLSC